MIFDCCAKQMFHTCIQYNRCYTHDKKLKNKALTVTYQIATQISSGWAQMDVMLQLVSQVPVPLQLDTSKSQNLHSWGSRNGCKGCIPSRIKQKQDHPLNIYLWSTEVQNDILRLGKPYIIRSDWMSFSGVVYIICNLGLHSKWEFSDVFDKV